MTVLYPARKVAPGLWVVHSISSCCAADVKRRVDLDYFEPKRIYQCTRCGCLDNTNKKNVHSLGLA